jgi:hypothetical protein
MSRILAMDGRFAFRLVAKIPALALDRMSKL